jgi:hypothetical protein
MRFEVLYPGSFQGLNGSLDVTREDLQQIVENYQPEKRKVPLVIGHPQIDSPAYGWVDKFELAADDRLWAHVNEVEQTFATMLSKKMFTDRSAKVLTKPDGTKQILHIGFLGAHPPAVEGLKPVELGEPEGEAIEVELGGFYFDSQIVSLARNIREYILERDGVEVADRVVPTWMLDTMAESNLIESNGASFAMAGENKEQTVDLAAREANLVEREKAIAAREAQQLETELAAFIDARISEGKVLPAQKEVYLTTMRTLASQPVELAAGEKSPLESFKESLINLPKQVELAAQPEGVEAVELGAKEQAQKVIAYRNEMRGKGIEISYAEAAEHVRNQ